MPVLHRVQQRDGHPDPDYMFWCPGCKCGHAVWVTRANGHTGATWGFNGNMEKPTFQPSLLIHYDTWYPPVTPENLDQWKREPWQQEKRSMICHSVVTDGVIHYCADSTHEFSGKAIPMVDFDAIPVEPPPSPHPKT